MAIDRKVEFQSILDVLNCLDVTGQNQRLILEVIESNIETWEQMQLKQRSCALQSIMQFIADSVDVQPQSVVKSSLEQRLLAMSYRYD